MFDTWLQFHEKHELLKQELESFLQKQHANLNAYTVCYILKDKDLQELRLTELAEQLCLSVSATSRLVAKLEAETQFVRREACDEDNRAIYVVLTDVGRSFLNDVTNDIETIIKKTI